MKTLWMNGSVEPLNVVPSGSMSPAFVFSVLRKMCALTSGWTVGLRDLTEFWVHDRSMACSAWMGEQNTRGGFQRVHCNEMTRP